MAFGYARWRARRIAELEGGSEVVETARGPVELARRGEPPFVLLLHGGPGGHDQAFPADPLHRAGYGVLAPSRPGYLRTPLATGRTYEEQADAFAALLDSLGIDRVAAYGLSAGGPCAIQFAARHPDRTSALLLACAATQTYATEISRWTRALFLSGAGTRLQLLLFDRFPRFAVRQLLDQESSLPASDKARLAAEIADAPQKRALARQLASSLTPYDVRADGLDNDLVQLAAIGRLPFERVECPALVAHGTADADVSFANAELAASEIPNAELYAMEGGWHLLNLSDGADAFERAQVEFLNKHLRPA